MKNGKAAGSVGISIELIKYGTESLIELIAQMLNE